MQWTGHWPRALRYPASFPLLSPSSMQSVLELLKVLLTCNAHWRDLLYLSEMWEKEMHFKNVTREWTKCQMECASPSLSLPSLFISVASSINCLRKRLKQCECVSCCLAVPFSLSLCLCRWIGQLKIAATHLHRKRLICTPCLSKWALTLPQNVASIDSNSSHTNYDDDVVSIVIAIAIVERNELFAKKNSDTICLCFFLATFYFYQRRSRRPPYHHVAYLASELCSFLKHLRLAQLPIGNCHLVCRWQTPHTQSLALLFPSRSPSHTFFN